IADKYVDRLAALDPCTATVAGVPGHDHEMTDYSPAGIAERVEFSRQTLATLARAPQETDADRLAAGGMRDRLQRDIDFYDAHEDLRPLRIIGSPVQAVRQVFDLMPFDNDADWETARE